MRSLGRLFITAAALALGGAGGAFAWHAAISSPDRTFVDVAIYDSEGNPIFATDEATALRLYEETGQRSLLGAHRPHPEPVVVSGRPSERAADLTRLFALQVVGRQPGDVFRTPVHPKPFGDWNETILLPRKVGSFDRAHTVDAELFERSFPGSAVGDRIFLPSPVEGNATIVSLGAEEATYRVDVAEGQALAVSRLGFVATAIDVSEDEFSLRYDAPIGHEFAVRGKCGAPFYDLEPGSYRVRASDPTSLVLAYSPTPYPELVGKDLYAEVRVRDVVAATSPLRPPFGIKALLGGDEA